MGMGTAQAKPDQEGPRPLLFSKAIWDIIEDAMDTISHQLVVLATGQDVHPDLASASYSKLRRLVKRKPMTTVLSEVDEQMVSIALAKSRFFADELHIQPGVDQPEYLIARESLQVTFKTEIKL